MRLGFVVAAAMAVTAPAGVMAQTAPDSRPKGYFGTFTAVITQGELFQNRDGDPITTDLAGRTFTLNWRNANRYNVPTPDNFFGTFPVPILDRLVVNSADFRSDFYDFFSRADDDPFEDSGAAVEFASFSGSEDGGSFLLSRNSNGSLDAGVAFTFDQTGGRLAGNGRINTFDESSIEELTIRFDITGGQVFAEVPEPATWAMMISGFGMVGAAARRRVRARVAFA